MQAIIGHLKEQFSKARPILFTGAGFSCDAHNISNENVPTGVQLKRKLWDLCFKEKPFDDRNTLQDLFELAKLRHSGELISLLRRSFTVKSDGLPEWYETVFTLPWYRVYTLNIDDLAFAAQRRFKLQRPLRAISAMTGKLRVLSEIKPDYLDYIYLNGSLDDAPHAVTFSTNQYAERLSRDQPWYYQLVEDIMTHPIVFMGTQLEEPPLWQYIQKRQDRGGADQTEYRPKSYIVSRNLPEAKATTLKINHNVTYVEADSKSFSEQVLEEIGPEAAIGHEFLRATESKNTAPQILREVSELSASDKASPTSLFLSGMEPSWSDIRENRAIIRESDQNLSKLMSAQLKTPAPRGCIVVVGTAGTGKSTLMKRAALTLAAEQPVAWIDQFSGLSPRTIVSAMTAPKSPKILFIDDSDVFGSELSVMTREICLHPNSPLVILSVPSARVDRVINPSTLDGIPLVESIVGNLCDSDIESLIALLERENYLGLLIKKTGAERIQIFRSKCDRQLLVAMIEATSGKRFDDKVSEEYNDLDASSQKIYATVALATALRFGASKHEILLSVDGLKNLTLNSLAKLETRKLIFKIRGGDYIGRHKVIADTLLKRLGKEGKLGEVMFDFTWSVATQIEHFTDNKDPRRRLLSRLLNHDNLRDLLGSDDAAEYYAELEAVLSPDFHYWLHRGSLEVERGNLELAERFLANARGLNSSDLNTLTEFAYLQFLKAIRDPLKPGAEKMVEDAEQILRDNISRRGDRDPHSYHILATNMLQWLRTRAVPRREIRGRLETLRTMVQYGIRKHPRNPHLLAVMQQIEEELRVTYSKN